MIIFDITPIPKPRMTRGSKFDKDNKQINDYWAFKDELGYKANLKQFKLGYVVDLVFIIPFKKNWDDKTRRQMDGLCHQEKPDTDNYIKAFQDALVGEDCKVWNVSGKKYWGEKGAILVLRNEFRTGRFMLNEQNYNQFI